MIEEGLFGGGQSLVDGNGFDYTFMPYMCDSFAHKETEQHRINTKRMDFVMHYSMVNGIIYRIEGYKYTTMEICRVRVTSFTANNSSSARFLRNIEEDRCSKSRTFSTTNLFSDIKLVDGVDG